MRLEQQALLPVALLIVPLVLALSVVILAQLRYYELLLHHLDLLVESLKVEIVKAVHMFKEYPGGR